MSPSRRRVLAGVATSLALAGCGYRDGTASQSASTPSADEVTITVQLDNRISTRIDVELSIYGLADSGAADREEPVARKTREVPQDERRTVELTVPAQRYWIDAGVSGATLEYVGTTRVDLAEDTEYLIVFMRGDLRFWEAVPAPSLPIETTETASNDDSE